MKHLIDFNREELLKIVKNIYALSHIKVSIFDENMEEIIYYPEKYCNFCKLIRTNKEADEVCLQSDKTRFEEIRRTGENVFFVCPHGLNEYFFPIKINGLTVGYITLGQVLLDNSSKDEVMKKIEKYGLDQDEVKSAINSISITKQDVIDATKVIVGVCAKYFYEGNYISVKKDDIAMNIYVYINGHLNEPLTIDSLCKKFYISRATLCKAFKDKFDCSIGDYIKNSRLEKSKEYIKDDPNLRISDVAGLIGIEYNYFVKSFYRKYGITPKKYQQLVNRKGAKMYE